MSVELITRRRLLAAFGGAGILLAAPTWAVPKKTPGKPLNVALVGLGSYASEQLAPGLALTRHCKLAGIVTGTPSKIPQWQAKYGIADRNVYTYENFDRIAGNDAIDVVYIVTPTHLHAPLTLRAAAAGKHVWCEKPMAMHAGQCEAMIAACKRNKVALTIGYRMQHEPNTRRVIAMASEKPFGAMQRVRAEAGYSGYHGTKSRPSVAVAFAVRRRCDVRHGRVSAQCRALYRRCRAAGCDGQALDRPPRSVR